MKSTVVKIVLSLLLLALPVITCFSVKLDGVDDGIEWAEASCVALIDKKDSNKIDHGSVSYIVDKNGFDVYFLIYFSDKSASPYESAALMLTFGNDVIAIDCKGNVVNPNPDLYIVEVVTDINENDGCYCELMIGFKRGVGESLSGKICFIDGEGTHSYHYPFTVINRYAATTSEEVPTTKVTVERTTKPKTSSDKTTKTRTTRPDPSSKETELHKTTKKATADSENNKTVVYFLEKDIVVSEVYVGSVGIGSTEPVGAINSENIVQQTVVDNKAEMYNEGVEIFRVVCVISGILLGVLAVWVGFNNRKSVEASAAQPTTQKEESDSAEDGEDK